MDTSDNNMVVNEEKKKPSYCRAIWITAIPFLLFIGIPMLFSIDCEAHKTGTYDCMGAGYLMVYGLIIGVHAMMVAFIASILVIKAKRERKTEIAHLEQEAQNVSDNKTTVANGGTIEDDRSVNRALFNMDLICALIGIILLPMGFIGGLFKSFSVIIALGHIIINIFIIATQRGKRLQVGELYIVLASLVPALICIDGILLGEGSLMDASLYGNPLLAGPMIVAILIFTLYIIASSLKKPLKEISKNVLFILSVTNILLSALVIVLQ